MLKRLLIIISLLLLVLGCSKNKEPVYVAAEIEDPNKLYSEALQAIEKRDFFYAQKKFFEADILVIDAYSSDNTTNEAHYYDDYTGSIQIYQLDEQNNRRYGIELIECFPKTIAAQQLDALPSTTAQTCDVSFSYRYWRNLTDERDLPRPLLETIRSVLANQVERALTRNIPKVLRKL
mgnify:CR=1 FL=1